MTASLEPPSLKRRGDDPGDPREPGGAGGPTPEPPDRHRRHQLVALAVVVVLLSAVAGVVLVVLRSSDSGGDREALPQPSSQAPGPQLPPAEYDAVETAGRTALSTWARPGLRYAAWWKALSPLLSPAARSDYAETDPSQLPRLTLRRAADVVAGPSADTATVYVETGRGRFGVDLTRQDARSAWRASRFLFPDQASSLS